MWRLIALTLFVILGIVSLTPGCVSTSCTYIPIVQRDLTPTTAPTATTVPSPTPIPTPLAGIANGDFEQGHTKWLEIPGNAVITNFPVEPAYAGQWIAQLGGAAGTAQEIQQSVKLPAKTPLTLQYAYYDDGGSSSGTDIFIVFVNTTIINNDFPLGTGGYRVLRVDLSAFAGQTVTLRFRLEVGDHQHPSYVLLDNIGLTTP
jgi:hypothetical protein